MGLAQPQITMGAGQCLGFSTASGSVHDPRGSAERHRLETAPIEAVSQVAIACHPTVQDFRY
jgi:hypothetical protein